MTIKNEEKISLIKRNTAELINEESVGKFMKKGIAYCGYECSGEIHLGHLVTIIKLLDLQKAGIKIKILLADWHTWLNQKGDWNFVNNQLKQWEKGMRAIGLDAEFVKGTEFQRKKEYLDDVFKLALKVTINRGLRSMQQVARDLENAKISQIIYPLMQVADIKALKTNFVIAGIDQRKIYMLGFDAGKEINLPEAVYIYTPIIPSLKGKEGKMSSSVPESLISIRDNELNIKKKINKAYCRPGELENNPVLSIAKLIIFPKNNTLKITRDKKHGGDMFFKNYLDLEDSFESGKIHPFDLKNAVSESLEKIIKPIRNAWE